MAAVAWVLALTELGAAGREPFCPADVNARSISLLGKWRFRLDKEVKKGKGQARNGWETAELDDRDWAAIEVRQSWEPQGYAYNGIAWYRARVFLPAEWERSTLVLQAGRPDDAAETYFNGVSLGSTKKFGEHISYVLQPEQVRFGAVNTRCSGRARSGSHASRSVRSISRPKDGRCPSKGSGSSSSTT